MPSEITCEHLIITRGFGMLPLWNALGENSMKLDAQLTNKRLRVVIFILFTQHCLAFAHTQ